MKKLFGLVMVLVLASLLSISSLAAPYVAYWSFDENATEEINGYTPSNPGDLTLVDGKNGKSYAGAGSDATGIITYDNVNIPIVDNFTFASWVKADFDVENGGYYVMMAKNEKATDGHFEMYFNPKGQFSIYGTNTEMTVILESEDALDDAQWHHYCVTVENSVYKLYVDGILDVTYEGTPLNIAEGPLFLGSLVDYTLPSQALVDDMFISDTIVAESDISALMNDAKNFAYTLAGKSSEDVSEDVTQAPEIAETPEAALVEAPTKATPPAAQTSDVITLLVVVMLISTGTVVLSKKRSR
ncbi:MAG: LamG domain-containing protein [Eubacteriales bacterium]|nr:LamG domain-containing protein [Eubacteriales bacterium]